MAEIGENTQEIGEIEATPQETVKAEALQPELPLEETKEPEPGTESVSEETTTESKTEEPVIEEPKPDWKDRELKKKHAQIMEARRQLEARDAELAALKAGQTVTAVTTQEIEAKARELLERQHYVDSCNSANEMGQKNFKGEWKQSLETLEQLGGFDTATMRGIMATGSPDKALYLLGKDPNEYHRIMDMPFERRIVELTKLVEKPLVAPKQVSQAPAPVRTVGGTAAPAKVELNDKMSDEEWYAAAKAARAKKFANRR